MVNAESAIETREMEGVEVDVMSYEKDAGRRKVAQG